MYNSRQYYVLINSKRHAFRISSQMLEKKAVVKHRGKSTKALTHSLLSLEENKENKGLYKFPEVFVHQR